MRNILIVTGLNTSEKRGGLERWYINLSRLEPTDIKIYLFYNQKLPVDSLTSEFKSNRIYPSVFKFSEITEEVDKFRLFVESNKVGYVIAHFENTVQVLPHAKKMGLKTAWSLFMGNYYYVNTDWRKNFKLFIGTQLHRLKIYRYLFYVDKVYCASHGVQKEFKNFFSHNHKFEVNYLGLEEEFLRSNLQKAQGRKKANTGEIVITCIAFHGKVKGIDIYVRAISELNKRGYDNVHYTQIGGSQFMDDRKDTLELHELASSLQIKNLSWLGIQNDVTPFLLETDIYCQPSRHEALSFTVMEAMSVELPVVAANTCGLPELIHNDENGFLFEIDNYLDLADKLELLINDEELRKRMGAKSLEIVNLPVFKTENNIKKILEDLQIV